MAETCGSRSFFVVSLFVFFVLILSCQAEQVGGNFKNDQSVVDVLAGKLKVANAAWWGFERGDSTAAIQSAINSGASKVIIPYMGSDWIVRPIRLVSNQEIVFEPGVVIAAKKGQFKGDHDSLFRAEQNKNITLRGYGATWRMNKADYTDPNNYIKAEWRMGFMCLSSKNIKVLGLTIAGSGGDGIYLGNTAVEFIGKPAYNSDIVIKDCIFDNNYRQGISVIGAENLLIENCIFRNTSGTAPADGIDFEPNSEDNKLTNCIVRNCVFENNDGCGVQVCVTHLSEKTEPVSVLIENCHIRSTKSWGFLVGTVRDEGVSGKIHYKNCTVENTGKGGFVIYDKPDGSLDIQFTNCKWKKPFLGADEILDLHAPMTSIAIKGQDPAGKGATRFSNCYLFGAEEKQFFVPMELEKSDGIIRINDYK
ncbi:MAG: right-handed parallel beta-helix repeat-containing protein [Planctomycetota bacterium]